MTMPDATPLSAGSLHPRLAWTIAMIPITAGAGIAAMLSAGLVFTGAVPAGLGRLVLWFVVSCTALGPLAAWYLIWGRIVRWTPRTQNIAIVIAGAGTMLVTVSLFVLLLQPGPGGWILVLAGAGVVATLGALGLALVCRSPGRSGCIDEINCPCCGYDLRMQTTIRCPECGTSYTLAALLDADAEPPPIGLEWRS
jgi:hypothetical protein